MSWKTKVYKIKVVRVCFELFTKLCYRVSDKIGVMAEFRMVMGYPVNFKDPQTLNQKVQWLKFNDNSLLKRDCADKYEVRKYVESKGLKEILNEFEGKGVYDSFNEINFEDLPNKFVLKCNHGCGANAIIKDKSTVNMDELEKKFNSWMSHEFGHRHFEPQYFGIKPKIICEKYLEDNFYKELPDYKFYCCNGKVVMTIVMLDRFKGGTHYYHFDRDWNYIESNDKTLSRDEIIKKIPKTANIEKMYKIAEKLSEDFVFVRTDLYCVNDKIYFGELTFTPTGGLDNDYSQSIDEWVGSQINLKSNVCL